MKKIIFALLVTCFIAVGCKTEKKEPKETVKSIVKAENIEGASFKISGMTCEMGCAKLIAKKLSNVEGVVEADVVFADSIAKVRFDKTKTDATKLMKFVDGMANNSYKTSGMKKCEKKCDKSIKECSESTQKACKGKCEGKCKDKADKKGCMKECEKACCAA